MCIRDSHGINRLRNSNSKSRIIILLSDGSNNAGELEPVTAANFAKEYGIKIYAIGVGANKEAPFPYICLSLTNITLSLN